MIKNKLKVFIIVFLVSALSACELANDKHCETAVVAPANHHLTSHPCGHFSAAVKNRSTQALYHGFSKISREEAIIQAMGRCRAKTSIINQCVLLSKNPQ